MNARTQRNRRNPHDSSHARRARAFAVAGSALLVAGWVALSACSNVPEGERCQAANNNEDCQAGLVCLGANQVNPNYNDSDRCCPADRAAATHPACSLQQNPIGADATTPADTGPSGEADATPVVPDAAPDADATTPDASPDAADASDAGA